jgi:hypothetical protein
MGADYDSNGDGQIDSDALRYQSGESEAAYVTRITTTLRSTIRDANTHLANSSTSFDYIQSDNTHPTYFGSATIGINIFTGSGSGSGAPDFSGGQIVGGKNPQWNGTGHEAWVGDCRSSIRRPREQTVGLRRRGRRPRRGQSETGGDQGRDAAVVQDLATAIGHARAQRHAPARSTPPARRRSRRYRATSRRTGSDRSPA